MAALSPANVHDFNGDGTSDILWWDNNGGTNDVQVWNEANEKTPQAIKLGNVNPTQYQFAGTGDFNGDGITDILWHSLQGSQDQYVVWQMDSSFKATAYNLGVANPAIYKLQAIGDFNADGTSDLLWVNTLNNQELVWNNHSNQTPTSALVTNTPQTTLGPGSGPGTIGFTSSTGFQSTTPATTYPGFQVIADGDYNGDHSTELLVTDYIGGDLTSRKVGQTST